MLGLARPACGGSSDLSFPEPFGKKWKPDRSCLSELGGMLKHPAYNRSSRTTFRVCLWCHCTDEEEFDSTWEIPEEPSEVMEMSTSSAAVRSFEER